MTGLYIYCKFFLINKDQFVKNALIKCSILTPSRTTLRAFILALTPALGLLVIYTNKNIERATKLAIKSFIQGQEYGQTNFTP